MPTPKSARVELLSGWKQIASYLGKGVRTVQRYERELSLPVRRPARKSSGSVMATKAELDAWVAAIPLRNSFQLSQAPVRQNVIDTKAVLAELKRHVAELRRLRGESAELRKTLHESVQLLQKNLRFSIDGPPSERRVQATQLSSSSKKVQ